MVHPPVPGSSPPLQLTGSRELIFKTLLSERNWWLGLWESVPRSELEGLLPPPCCSNLGPRQQEQPLPPTPRPPPGLARLVSGCRRALAVNWVDMPEAGQEGVPE